jgi:hypothetical protein
MLLQCGRDESVSGRSFEATGKCGEWFIVELMHRNWLSHVLDGETAAAGCNSTS